MNGRSHHSVRVMVRRLFDPRYRRRSSENAMCGSTEVQTMRMSLRELLAIVSIIGIGVAGLFGGPPIAWLGVAICFVIIAAAAIAACAALGRLRASAIGFVIPVVLYGATVYVAGEREIGINSAQASLPTSKLFQSILQPRYPRSGGLGREKVMLRKENAESVMPLGHLLVAVGLGYVGAKFGAYVRESSTVSER